MVFPSPSCIVGTLARKALALARSSGVMPESRTIRTKYGSALESTNLADSFATSVDSACFGRKLALSFSWTSLSFPTAGPPSAPSTSQAISTAAMPARHVHRFNVVPSLSVRGTVPTRPAASVTTRRRVCGSRFGGVTTR